MLELYSQLPLQYLAQRKHEIEDFKVNMFPEIEKVLDDMGCSGSVDFTSSKSSPAGYDTVVIKAKKPGAVPMDAIVTVKFPSAHPRNLYTIQWKDADGVKNIDTALVGKAAEVPGVVEVYFKEAFGESSESREAKSWEDSYTAWQIHAIDAEEALKKNLSQFFDKRGAVPELTTKCDVSTDPKSDKNSTVLYWKDTPIVTFEFEGRSKYRTIWNCLGNETKEGHLNLDTYTADDPSEELIDGLWPEIQGHIETLYLDESNKSEESDDPNVADAKECKAALDKYVLGLESMKDRGLEAVLTEDVSIGAEMPCARVELGVRKDGKLDPFFTFDFSSGMCGINFHLVGEKWDETLSDYPSVDSMIEDLVPDILDEIESQ